MKTAKAYLLLGISLALWLHSYMPQAFGQGLDLNPDEIRGQQNKKPVAVLESRYFLKTLRPELGFLVGSQLNEAYTSTNVFGIRASLFGNEWIGGEYQYVRAKVSDSEDRKALNSLVFRSYDKPSEITTPDPEVNPFYGAQDFALVGTPFYGKVNFINQLILYLDLYGTVGFTRVQTKQGDLNGIILGGGQRFYLFDKWSARLDFRDRTYVETRRGQSSRKHLWTFDFGLSYFFL